MTPHEVVLMTVWEYLQCACLEINSKVQKIVGSSLITTIKKIFFPKAEFRGRCFKSLCLSSLCRAFIFHSFGRRTMTPLLTVSHIYCLNRCYLAPLSRYGFGAFSSVSNISDLNSDISDAAGRAALSSAHSHWSLVEHRIKCSDLGARVEGWHLSWHAVPDERIAFFKNNGRNQLQKWHHGALDAVSSAAGLWLKMCAAEK